MSKHNEPPTTNWLLVRSAILTNEDTKTATDQIMGLWQNRSRQLIEQMKAEKSATKSGAATAWNAAIDKCIALLEKEL